MNFIITRKENWYDTNSDNKISLSEWTEYIGQDPEMRLDNFAQLAAQGGETIRIEEDGICVWIKYSGEGIGENHAWFTYSNGNIDVKNPDQEITNKMVEVALKLKAKVQGDDGEFYDHADFLYAGLKNTQGKVNEPAKKWWKFWK